MENVIYSQAYRRGYAAYLNSADVWQNEYEEGEQAGDWREGWLAAAEAHEREADMNERDKVLDSPTHGQARDINRRSE